MPSFFAIPNKSAGGGKGGGRGGSALSLAFKVLRNQENTLDTDDGGKIVDPFQLDAIISGYEKLYPLAKDEGDRLDIENKVSSYKATRASLSRKQTETEISGALYNDTKEIKYRYGNKHANDPLTYLQAVADNQTAIIDVALSYADELDSQGRVPEANNIRKQLQSRTEEIEVFDRIADLYDVEQQPDGSQKRVLKKGIVDERIGTDAGAELKNYAIVYKTDANGRVMDMNVRRRYGQTLEKGGEDDIASGAVVPLVDAQGNHVKMDGLMVFVNKQTDGKSAYVKLGGISARVRTSGNQYDFNSDLSEDEDAAVNKAVIEDRGFKGGDDEGFRSGIVSLNPAVSDTPGMYAVTSGNRVFRRDVQGKWDELSKEVLPSFPDYNESQALKVDALGVEHLRNNAGVLITPNHLKGGFNPFTGQTSLPYIPNKGEAFTPLSAPAPFGGQSTAPTTQAADRATSSLPAGPMSVAPNMSVNTNMSVAPTRPTEVRTNRQKSDLTASGAARFSQTSQSLFRGRPGS